MENERQQTDGPSRFYGKGKWVESGEQWSATETARDVIDGMVPRESVVHESGIVESGVPKPVEKQN